MTNWNICEEPWPGPDSHPTMSFAEVKELIVNLNRQFGKTASPVVKQVVEGFDRSFKDFIAAMATGSKQIESTPQQLNVKDHALYCVKNRNTGPRYDRNFGRNGRRLR